MKKTLLTLLLTLVMVVCFAAFTASAEETHTDHCVCGGSAVGVHDHACETLEWKAWTEGVTDISKLGSGNFYLTGDVAITAATTLKEGTTIRICLNGHNITSTSTRVVGYLAKGYISFCDCSGEQDADGQWTWDGTVTAGEGSGQYGGVMYTRYKTTVEVYGGNFTGLSTNAKNGAVFLIANDGSPDADGNGTVSDAEKSLPENAATFNMYGGNIFATEGKTTSGSGGLLATFHYVNINIHGGYIHGGTAKAGNGGNISVNGNLTISGGEIYDGTSGKGYSGGSIYVAKGSCTISGGKFYNSTSGANGGHIYLNKTTTGTTITGGTFSGGAIAAGYAGKDVYIVANVVDSNVVNPLVLNGAIDTLDYSTDKTPIVLGEDFSANKITVNTTVDYGTIVKSGATVENVKCFEPADSAKHLVLVNDTIRLANPETAQKHYTCYCGGNGAYLASSIGHKCTMYSDWVDLNAHLAGLAPEAGSLVELTGNNKRYYLSDDLTIDYYLALGDDTSSTTKAYKIYLDLNGHTLTGASTLTDHSMIICSSQVYVCDSSFNPNAATVRRYRSNRKPHLQPDVRRRRRSCPHFQRQAVKWLCRYP